MWGHVGTFLDYHSIRAAHATSTEARRGMNTNVRKRTAMKRAYSSATSRTVAPLVRVLKSELVRGILRGAPRSYWATRRVKMGQYQVLVQRASLRPGSQKAMVSISWLTGDMHLQLAEWDGTNTHVSKAATGGKWDVGFEVRQFPRGTTTVTRLIKAALNEARMA